ncbi:MAG: response regulator [Gammaproteobacteria bacterium]|nr:response regulator [Gammaproteobacteria bacterium]
MSKAHEFGVYLIGISDSDKHSLQRMLRLRGNTGIARNYVITEDSSADPNKIYVVNSDSDESISYWCKRFLGSDKLPKVATVFAGKRRIKADKVYHVTLPFVAPQVLSVFDTITVKEMNFIPELTIGAAADEMDLSQTFLEEIAESKFASDFRFTAMVVDDSQPVRKQLEIELKLLGAKVELAENGEQALALSRDRCYDIIFLDVVMPGMDGYKVCKVLKKDFNSKNTPVVMLTGKSSPFDKVKGTLSGCDTYLTKPLQHEEFQSITKKYIPQLAVVSR